MERQELDRVLEASVVLSWPELMPDGGSGLVHVEYHFDMTCDICFLQVWSSQTRGVWNLICSYSAWPFESRNWEVRFENGYTSERFREALDLVLRNQEAFLRPPDLGRPGLLQIAAPTEKERIAAASLIKKALNRLESTELVPA